MERLNIGFVLNLLVLFLAIDSGNCIKCYICQSKMNPSCGDPFKSQDLHLQECTPESLQNVNQEVGKAFRTLGSALGLDTIVPNQQVPYNVPLVCQKITFSANGEKVTVRGCQTDSVEDKSSCKALTQLTGKDTINFCDVCNKDGCNGVGSVRAPAILGLVALVSSIVIFARG